jgi:ribosome-binding factor A
VSFDDEKFERHRGYRQERLERIVAEALEFELLPALEDPALQNLHVFKVELKNLACIHVLLMPGSPEQLSNVAKIKGALQRAENKLRRDLALIVRMKRMPLLRLNFLPIAPDSGKGGGG